MQYRNEIKHIITPSDRAMICANMRAVAELDSHAKEKGYYTIRSLYFDNIADKALREKIDGVNQREKFRMRYYNGDPSVIRLEKKVKQDGAGYKVSCPLSREEAQKIVDGSTMWMAACDRALVVELYALEAYIFLQQALGQQGNCLAHKAVQTLACIVFTDSKFFHSITK